MIVLARCGIWYQYKSKLNTSLLYVLSFSVVYSEKLATWQNKFGKKVISMGAWLDGIGKHSSMVELLIKW